MVTPPSSKRGPQAARSASPCARTGTKPASSSGAANAAARPSASGLHAAILQQAAKLKPTGAKADPASTAADTGVQQAAKLKPTDTHQDSVSSAANSVIQRSANGLFTAKRKPVRSMPPAPPPVQAAPKQVRCILAVSQTCAIALLASLLELSCQHLCFQHTCSRQQSASLQGACRCATARAGCSQAGAPHACHV